MFQNSNLLGSTSSFALVNDSNLYKPIVWNLLSSNMSLSFDGTQIMSPSYSNSNINFSSPNLRFKVLNPASNLTVFNIGDVDLQGTLQVNPL